MSITLLSSPAQALVLQVAPEGDYDFNVIRCRELYDGNPRFELYLEISNHTGRYIVRDYLVITANAIWKLYNFFYSVGWSEKAGVKTWSYNDFLGEKGRCHTRNIVYNRNNTQSLVTDITNYI